MDGKLKFLVLLMILPLLTIAVANMPEADANAEGGEKSCSKKDKTMKDTSYNKSTEMSDKSSKNLQF